jgi:hypothetical protein
MKRVESVCHERGRGWVVWAGRSQRQQRSCHSWALQGPDAAESATVPELSSMADQPASCPLAG